MLVCYHVSWGSNVSKTKVGTRISCSRFSFHVRLFVRLPNIILSDFYDTPESLYRFDCVCCMSFSGRMLLCYN